MQKGRSGDALTQTLSLRERELPISPWLQFSPLVAVPLPKVR